MAILDAWGAIMSAGANSNCDHAFHIYFERKVNIQLLCKGYKAKDAECFQHKREKKR